MSRNDERKKIILIIQRQSYLPNIRVIYNVCEDIFTDNVHMKDYKINLYEDNFTDTFTCGK